MQLETQRLIIRSWQKNDVDPYAKIVAQPEVMQFIGNGRSQDFSIAQAFVTRCIDIERDRPWLLWAVEHKADQQLIGFCGFAPYGDEIEIGWRLDREYWSQGFGTEAARAVLDYGLKKLGFDHVVSVAQTDNTASNEIMKGIGMKYREITIDSSCGRETVVYQTH